MPTQDGHSWEAIDPGENPPSAIWCALAGGGTRRRSAEREIPLIIAHSVTQMDMGIHSPLSETSSYSISKTAAIFDILNLRRTSESPSLGLPRPDIDIPNPNTAE